MKALIVTSLLLASLSAQARIACTASVLEFFADGTSRRESAELKVDLETVKDISMSAELDGRAFVFNGSKEDNTYLVSITWGPDYRTGALTTASFNPAGRLQISMVDNGLVHKLECFNNK